MSVNLNEDDEIKGLFVDESLEALQRVEKMLLEAEQGHARPAIIDVMFRDMHTIKGTSALLGYEKTAALAHAAEDLMASLRDHSLPAQPRHFAHMVEVVDALRKLIEAARDRNSEEGLDFAVLVAGIRQELEAPQAAAAVAVPPPVGGQPSAAPAGAAPAPAPSAPAPFAVAPAAPVPYAAAPGASAPVGYAAPPAPSAPVAYAVAPAPSAPVAYAPPPAPSAPVQYAVAPAASAPVAYAAPPAPSAPVQHAPALAPAASGLAAVAAPQPSAPVAPSWPSPAPGEPAGARGPADGEPKVTAEAERPGGEPQDGTVRVNVGVLDKLMNLMGELVLARNQMVQIARGLRDTQAQAAAQRLSLVTSDLQEQIMKTRMQPVARVFEKIPRLVRDLCQQTGKRMGVQVEGTATELDKALVEAIRDPVMHIVRNTVDHGIETPEERVAKGKPTSGKLLVRAVHQGSTVTIELKDDGRGIDPAAVRRVAVERGVITQQESARLTDREATELVFRPGFSTAKKVTSISGRGVGLDVVRTHVERAGGQVELESSPGKGTTIRMKMPLTLAIIPALLVRDGGQRFAIPQANLHELVYLDEERVKREVELVRGAPIYRLRGEVLPLVRLSPLLRQKPSDDGHGGVSIVVVAIGQRRYGLVVESIHDTEEIVIKPLHSMLKRLSCYAGATVLGDGSMALILDVAGIATMAGIELTKSGDGSQESAARADEGTQSMLVFSAGDGARCAVPVSMVARLEQVNARDIEMVAGAEVLQYRGELMPIIRPESGLAIGAASPPASGVQQLLVFNFGRPVGLAVTEIIDTCDVEMTFASDASNVLGKAVIFGRTTLLVDVFSLVRQLAPGCLGDGPRRARRPRVLLADELGAMRAALAGFLRASGVDVVEVNPDALAREMRQGPDGRQFDALVAGLDSRSSADTVRSVHSEQPSLKVVGLARGGQSSFELGPCVDRTEREAVLEALAAQGLFTTPEVRP